MLLLPSVVSWFPPEFGSRAGCGYWRAHEVGGGLAGTIENSDPWRTALDGLCEKAIRNRQTFPELRRQPMKGVRHAAPWEWPSEFGDAH